MPRGPRLSLALTATAITVSDTASHLGYQTSITNVRRDHEDLSISQGYSLDRHAAEKDDYGLS
jgi:hypothetical protein